MEDFRIGFAATIRQQTPGVDEPQMAEAARWRWAAQHMGADWRNAVRVRGHVVTQEQGTLDVLVESPSGATARHKTVRAALRSLRE